MKKLSLIIGLLIISMSVMSVDKIALSDTLTAFAKRRARVARVSITNLQQRGNSIQVYTNKNLSYVTINKEDVDSLHNIVSQMVLGNQKGKVQIFTDGHEISELVNNQPQNRFVLPKVTPLTQNASLPYNVTSGLAGKHIVSYGSHGIYFVQSLDMWKWQRAKLLTTVEDVYTTSYNMPFLVPMLENAGAIVIQPRERCTNIHEVIVDDQIGMLANQKQNGAYFWQQNKDGGWGQPQHDLLENENPFTMGGFLYAPCSPNENHTLYYKPEIPEAGEYAVYVSYKSLPECTEAAEYIVHHKGQETLFKVNQQMGGGTWIYLGTFNFGTDADENYVSISNKGKKGSMITSDAIRFGGGMGSVARYASDETVENQKSSEELRTYQKQANSAHADEAFTSGYPRWIEGSRYYMQYCGIPDSVYNYTGSRNDYTDDYASRGRWVNYLAGGSATFPKGPGLNIPIHLCLAFHTDAGVTMNDNTIGTLLIYTDFDDEKKTQYETGVSRMAGRDYANYMSNEIVNDMRTLWAPEWTKRQLQNASYAETRNPKVPAVILELLSHQNFADMRYGLDPRVRFTISRSIYKSMLKFLAQQYNEDYTVQPLPVQAFKIERKNDELTLSWKPTEDIIEPTATPSYYIVYTRTNDSDWDNGVKVTKPTYSISAKKDVRYDFKIAAGNDGGISMESETLSAYVASNQKGNVLIVNGFTRVGAPENFCDSNYAGFIPESYGVPYKKEINYIGAQYEFKRDIPWMSDDNQGYGACGADQAKFLMAGNLFDYPVMHGKVLSEMGYSYVSTSVSALDSIAKDIDIVDIIMGKQKEMTLGVEKHVTDFKTFTPELQKTVKQYLANGGKMLVSGAYIGSDLNKNNADKKFMNDVLHVKYSTHHGTHNGTIDIQKVLPRMAANLQVTPDENITVAEDPDGLDPFDESATRIGRYGDTGISVGAATSQTIVLAFPLESVKQFDILYKNCIKYLKNE